MSGHMVSFLVGMWIIGLADAGVVVGAAVVAGAVYVGGLNLTEMGKQCGKPYFDTLAATAKDLGQAAAATVTKEANVCKPKDSTACDSALTCSLCNAKCYALVDLTNPCQKERVEILMFGPKVVGSAATATAKMAATAFNACGSKTASAACVGGDGMCNWCETTKTCHNRGSPLDKCVQESLKMFAVGAAKTANATLTTAQTMAKDTFDKAQVAAKKTYQTAVDDCTNESTQVLCAAAMKCFWCTDKCYFMGDLSNPCLQKGLGKITDAAGKVQSAGKRFVAKAGEVFTDMKNWGNGICGKHVDEKTCGAATTCSWCKDNSKCYIFGSVNNPCGVGKFITGAKAKMASAFAAAKSWWSSDGKDKGCSATQKSTQKTLQDADAAAATNLKMSCDALGKAQAFVERTMIASFSSADAATKQATAMTSSLEIMDAGLAVNTTANMLNEKGDTKAALDSFLKDSPCKKSSDAMQAASTVLFLIATTFLW